jgi:hypothetical protein
LFLQFRWHQVFDLCALDLLLLFSNCSLLRLFILSAMVLLRVSSPLYASIPPLGVGPAFSPYILPLDRQP